MMMTIMMFFYCYNDDCDGGSCCCCRGRFEAEAEAEDMQVLISKVLMPIISSVTCFEQQIDANQLFD